MTVKDFEKKKGSCDFRPEGYGFFKIPYIYFGDIKEIDDKLYYELVIFNKEHLGNEIGIASCDGFDVSDVVDIDNDLKIKLNKLLIELEKTPNKYKRIQKFIEEKTSESESVIGNRSESVIGNRSGRGNVFKQLLNIYIKKRNFDNSIKELLKIENNIILKYENGCVFLGSRDGMYRYIIVSNQTYIPINGSKYIVLEELKHSSAEIKKKLYSDIMKDIKITVSKIPKQDIKTIIDIISKNNPNLSLRANTILSLRNLRKI